ncbi:MAG: hypothetical protein JWM20_870 [Patescibacteria group bacterium]|nr:hypothetical protein [Patescibacteria group bacterium]
MFAFILFAIFCYGIYELFRHGKIGIAIFLILAFLVWAFFSFL